MNVLEWDMITHWIPNWHQHSFKDYWKCLHNFNIYIWIEIGLIHHASGEYRRGVEELYNLHNVMGVKVMMKWSLDVLVLTIWMRESSMQLKLGNMMISYKVIQHEHDTTNY